METEPQPDYTDIMYWAKHTLEQMVLNGQCRREQVQKYLDALNR